MRIGKLRNRIVIESRNSGQDSFGQPVLTWATFATVWASIEDLSARELVAASQLNSSVETKIRIRYLDGVTAAHRITHGGKIYSIVGEPIDPDGRKSELHLMCSRGINEG